MDPSTGKERRFSARSASRRRVWTTDEAGVLREAVAEDLSVSGLGVRAATPMQEGARVEVELFPDGGADELPLAPVAARVRWVEPLPNGGCRAGLELEPAVPPVAPPFSLTPLPQSQTPGPDPGHASPEPRRRRRKAGAVLMALLLLLLLLLLRREAPPRQAFEPGPALWAIAELSPEPAVEEDDAGPAFAPTGGGEPGDGEQAAQEALPEYVATLSRSLAEGLEPAPEGAESGSGGAGASAARGWPGVMADGTPRTLASLGGGREAGAGVTAEMLGRMVDALELGEGAGGQPGELLVLIESSAYRLTVFRGNRPLVSMPVGLGEDGATPPGDYYIANKITDPTWYNRGDPVAPGDPENPLGRRWMGLGRDGAATPLGMHPTGEEASIGQPMSRGCVRLLPEDAESLFRLCPIDTPVRIVP